MGRDVGTLGMSAGTSLAFEAEGASAIVSADSLLFNLRTLIRNAYESFSSVTPTVKQVIASVKDDIVKIGKWVEDHRGTRPISMTIYYPTYKSLARVYNKADLWVPTKDHQLAYAKLVEEVGNALCDQYKGLIKQVDCEFPSFSGRGIVMTHHVVDLTFTTGTTRLYLLESHTGSLKPYTQWYTKLTGGSELFYMPFNHLTIQIFGDRSTNFKSSKIGIKNVLKTIAKDARWTSATSYERVKFTIRNLPAGTDKAGLLMLL